MNEMHIVKEMMAVLLARARMPVIIGGRIRQGDVLERQGHGRRLVQFKLVHRDQRVVAQHLRIDHHLALRPHDLAGSAILQWHRNERRPVMVDEPHALLFDYGHQTRDAEHLLCFRRPRPCRYHQVAQTIV